MTGIEQVPDRAADVAARSTATTVAVFGPVTGRAAVLAAIGEALRFPGYYGRNLDALEECVTDLSWLPAGEVELVWAGGDPDAYRPVLDVLAAGGTPDRPLRVVLAAP